MLRKSLIAGFALVLLAVVAALWRTGVPKNVDYRESSAKHCVRSARFAHTAIQFEKRS
jgi:hypothetical protein